MEIFITWLNIALVVLHLLGLYIIKCAAFHINRRILKNIFIIDGLFIGMILIYDIAFTEFFPPVSLLVILLYLISLQDAFSHTAKPDKIYTLEISDNGCEDFFNQNHELIYIQYVIGTITDEDRHISVKLYAPVTQKFDVFPIRVKSTGYLKKGYLIVREVDDNGNFISKDVV